MWLGRTATWHHHRGLADVGQTGRLVSRAGFFHQSRRDVACWWGVYAAQCRTPCWSLGSLRRLGAGGRGASVGHVLSVGVVFRRSIPGGTRGWRQTGSGVRPSGQVHGSKWCVLLPCRLWTWGTQGGSWRGHYVFPSWRWCHPCVLPGAREYSGVEGLVEEGSNGRAEVIRES